MFQGIDLGQNRVQLIVLYLDPSQHIRVHATFRHWQRLLDYSTSADALLGQKELERVLQGCNLSEDHLLAHLLLVQVNPRLLAQSQLNLRVLLMRYAERLECSPTLQYGQVVQRALPTSLYLRNSNWLELGQR
jgi:hypothetical protein